MLEVVDVGEGLALRAAEGRRLDHLAHRREAPHPARARDEDVEPPIGHVEGGLQGLERTRLADDAEEASQSRLSLFGSAFGSISK